jgi:predicted Zn-dependent protease
MRISQLLTLSAATVLITACSTSPTGRSQLMLASDSSMNSQGAQAFDQLKKETPIEHDAALNAYVHCIVDPITRIAGKKLNISNWEVVIFKSDEVNAFALPGGKIGVYTGILKAAQTPAQLAAVLGHETGHVLAHHGAERYSQQMMSQGLATLLGTATAYETKDQTKANAVMLAVNGASQYGYLLPHSRQQESEADIIGLKLMAQAGFDPREAVTLWQNMSASGGKAPPELLSTHPSNARRIDDIRSHLAEDEPIYQAAANKPACRR